MADLKELIEECGNLIAAAKLTVAFAESATAGILAFEFSQSEHSGEILRGGLVCYDAHIKEKVLGVPTTLIEKYTPESAEVTKEMAIRLKKMMGADVVVSVTGLTTSGGSEGPGKPVGTMFYCVLIEERTIERREVFSGSAREIVYHTIEDIVKTIIKSFKGSHEL